MTKACKTCAKQATCKKDIGFLFGYCETDYDPINKTVAKHRGYGIDYNLYGQKEFSVQYCGDDFMFETEEEAKRFIDTL